MGIYNSASVPCYVTDEQIDRYIDSIGDEDYKKQRRAERDAEKAITSLLENLKFDEAINIAQEIPFGNLKWKMISWISHRILDSKTINDSPEKTKELATRAALVAQLIIDTKQQGNALNICCNFLANNRLYGEAAELANTIKYEWARSSAIKYISSIQEYFSKTD